MSENGRKAHGAPIDGPFRWFDSIPQPDGNFQMRFLRRRKLFPSYWWATVHNWWDRKHGRPSPILWPWLERNDDG